MRNCVSADAVTYDLVHTTQYSYSESVSISHHLARLTPRPLPHQTCLDYALQIDPAPAVHARHIDYFGNLTTFFAIQGAHRRLTVTARSRVSVRERDIPHPAATPPWEDATAAGTLPLDAVEAAFDSASTPVRADLDGYARESFPPGRPLLEAVLDLTGRIHRDFTFDANATTVATPMDEVFRTRRGVCQDFARLEIACLRSLGLAAHYVSGYLETIPPPGTPRQVGADASHAWLAVFCPGHGWIDVDPTNNLLPSTSHVTLGWGRDYADVSPIHGVILGGGEHTLQVSVSLLRADAG
jgi:transglutaminase-like putative cysteine protease